MKNNICKLFVSFIVLGFLLISCDNVVGLGPEINLDFPEINSVPEKNEPGSYLWGEENIIHLEVIQKFGISRVYMELWHTDFLKEKPNTVIEAYWDDNEEYWAVNINTIALELPDGNIRTQVTAIDTSNKRTTTTEMIYTVKNTPPKIEMTFPEISGDAFDLELETNHIIQGNDLIGIASDSYGIRQGYPQIMLWPEDAELNAEGIPVDPKWAKWRTVVDIHGKELEGDGFTVVSFRWQLTKLVYNSVTLSWEPPGALDKEPLDAGIYHFRLRTMDKLGIVNTYPNRLDNSFGEKDTSLLPNQFIKIQIVAPNNPVIYVSDVPQYYKGPEDFTATITVSTGNNIGAVRARVTNNDNAVNFFEDDELVVFPVPGNDKAFKVIIPYEDMPKTNGVIVSGEKILHVEAVDVIGNKGTGSKPFQLDITPPTMIYNEPLGFGTNPDLRVTSRIVFRGVAEDNERVSKMYYALGKNETGIVDALSESALFDPNNNANWHNTGLDSGTHLTAHPGSSGSIKARWGGSLSSWNWRFADINDLCSAANRSSYVTETSAGSDQWILPIYFKVVDVTGNVQIFKQSVIIAPELDIPEIFITSHANDQIVGGKVRVNGTASDNEMISKVEIKVTAQSDTDCDTNNPPSVLRLDWKEINLGNTSSDVGWYYDINDSILNLNPPSGYGLRKVFVEVRAWDAYSFNYTADEPLLVKTRATAPAAANLALSFSNSVPAIENVRVVKSGGTEIAYIPGEKITGDIKIRVDLKSVTPLSSIYKRGLEDSADTEVSIPPSTPIVSGNYRYAYSLEIPVTTSDKYANRAVNYTMSLQVSDSATPAPFRNQTIFYLDVDNFYPYGAYNGSVNAVGNYSISGTADDRSSGINIQGIQQVVVYFSRNNSGISLTEKSTAFSGVTTQWAMTGRRGTSSSITSEGTLQQLPVFPNVRQANGTFLTTNSGIVIDDNGSKGGYDMSFTGNPDKNWSVVFNSANLNDGPVTLNYVVFDTVGNAAHYTQDLYIANNRPVITNVYLATDITGSGSVASHESFTAGNTELSTGFRIRNNLFSIKLDTTGGNNGKYYKVSYVNRVSASASQITKGNVYTINNDPGDIRWIDYGVFGTHSNYSGVTFVATQNYTGASAATVWRYNDAAATVKTASLAANSEIIYDSFDSIPDSVTQGDDRYFIVKVYDTTVSAAMTAPVTQAVESSQLAHAVVVALNIDNIDEQAPNAVVDPFYWNSAADNSLYENSKANGHIELADDLPSAFNQTTGVRDRDPKVSGKVSLRGTASDDNIISSIYFRITNFTDNGAVQGSGAVSGYYRAAAYDSAAKKTTGTDRFSNGWKFIIESEEIDLDGHRIDWCLDFDSRFITNGASLDNTLSVIAVDLRSNASAPGTYRFDVVPYISGIETAVRTEGGLKDVNIRSADGKYSIVHGSNNTFITVKGFNLPVTSNTGAVRILTESQRTTHAGNPAAAAFGSTPTFSTTTGNTERTSIQVTNNSNSGYLTVWVNSIPSLNNINDNEARTSTASGSTTDGSKFVNMPNREADRNTTKNILLTDDRYLQFYATRKTNVANGYYPVMLMNGNNPVFGYIKNDGGNSKDPKPNNNTGSLRNSASASDETYGAGTGPMSLPQNAGPQRAEFIYTSGATRYKEYLIKNLAPEQMAMAVDSAAYNGDGGRYGHFTVHNNGYSGSSEYIYDRFSEHFTGANNSMLATNANTVHGWSAGNGINGVNPTAPTSGANTAMSFETRQVRHVNALWYPKLIIRGDSINAFAVNYLAYYESFIDTGSVVVNRINFRAFRVGRSADIGTGTGTAALFAAGQYDNYGRAFAERVNYSANAAVTAGRHTAVNQTALANAVTGTPSRYFDMALMGTGTSNRVVIVYFDESQGRLRLVSANNIDGSGTQVTGTNSVAFTAANITFSASVGKYVSMFINGNDIHIAAFDDANNTLRYFFIPSFNFTTNPATTIEGVTIDQFGTPGHWTDIKVNSAGVPYIAYYNAMESGGRDSIKIAFAKNVVTSAANVHAGVDANGYTTGNWEYRTVPALDPPQGGHDGFQKVNLGFMTDGTPMVGYLGTNIEFSYPVGE